MAAWAAAAERASEKRRRSCLAMARVQRLRLRQVLKQSSVRTVQ